MDLFAAQLSGGDNGPKGYPRRRKSVAALLAVIVLGAGADSSGAQAINQPIPIEEAYRMALKSHELIQIAEKEISKSKLLPKKALSMMLPHADARGGYQTVNKPINNASAFSNIIILPKDQTIGELSVKNSIYNPNYFPARRQANQVVSRNTENYGQVIQDVLFQVGFQYYQVLRAAELLKNAKELLKTAQEEVRVSKVKFSSGAVTEEGVLRAEMDQATAESKYVEGTNLLTMAKETLKTNIALKMAQYEVVKPAPLQDPKESYESLLGRAYDNRFDHKMALTEVELAKTAVEAVKAKFHPSVEASWDYYAVKHPKFDQESNNWAAIVSVKLPVLEGGLRVWELKEKQESLAQAKLTLDDKRRTIKIELEDAILTAQNNKSLILKLQKQVELSQKNYDITFSKFKYGAATMVEVSQAFAALSSAKTDLIHKTIDYQISLLAIEKAEGIFALDLIKSSVALDRKTNGLTITHKSSDVLPGEKSK
jgi:outer membrane protein TolC